MTTVVIRTNGLLLGDVEYPLVLLKLVRTVQKLSKIRLHYF